MYKNSDSGGLKEMSSILARIRVQMGGGIAGVSTYEYNCAHGAQIDFGDLTPYLTYDEH